MVFPLFAGSVQLSKLLATAIADQRHRHTKRLLIPQFMNQIGSGRYVAPLVRATQLNRASLIIQKPQKIISRQELVAELGETHATIAVETATHAILAEHRAHPEMLTHVTQKLNERKSLEPVVIVQDFGGRRGMFEIEKTEAQDIDDEQDFILAEALFRILNSKGID